MPHSPSSGDGASIASSFRSTKGAISIESVPWLRQLSSVLYKNLLLLSRRPLQVTLMILSSIGSVLLASLVAEQDDAHVDFGTVPLTPCGTVLPSFLANRTDEDLLVPLSHNEGWRNGFAVTLMAIGPMVHAAIVFLTIQTEIQTQMMGILRAAGLRDSAFWMSWWIPFIVTSFCNAFFGTVSATFLSIHALERIYFLGIFGSFFFLNLALTGASFFLAALCGTTRSGAATWCMMILIVSVFIPLLVQLAQSQLVHTPDDLEYTDSTPVGLFWVPRTTTVPGGMRSDGVEGDCEMPIVGKSRASVFETVQEQESNFPDDQFFVGCYFGAGYVNSMWNQDTRRGLAALFLFPYSHFASIWGNFLGYTAMPDRIFTSEEAWHSSESLAVASLQSQLDPTLGYDNTLYPQGSTLNTEIDYFTNIRRDDGTRLTNCPSPNARGYFCQDFDSSRCVGAVERVPTASPSVMNLFGFLTLLAIGYTLLASYLLQVFPGKNGAPRRFYYFLLPSYWIGGTRAKCSTSVPNKDPTGVHVKMVRKQYGSVEALKGVTVDLECGEVTAMLGHNGAGKTSLSSIISCEISPTSGDVVVFGYSVKDQVDIVRSLVSVCKQDDYLYPNLTAYEHLELFAALRGIPNDKIPSTVEQWLASVDLSSFQDHYSSSFSGGMKRRLSLACTTIGNRPVVVLDEPTTGMDPVSRRYVWKHIDSIKKNRVVLLTTHAMEEADLLADSVAVIRKGNLAAYGTPLELKSLYGSAMQFSLLVEPHHAHATERAIRRQFKSDSNHIGVVVGDAGNISVKITKIDSKTSPGGVAVDVLSDFVAWLENKDISCVLEYGFSNSSLEEVFLAVTEAGDESEDSHDDLDDYDICCNGCSKGCALCCLRGPCSCCCCPSPRSRIEDSAEEKHLVSSTGSVQGFSPILSSWRQARAIFHFSVARNWIGKASKASWIFHSIFVGFAALLMMRSNNSGIISPFLVIPTICLSLSLVSFITPIYRDRNNGIFYLIRSQGLMKHGYFTGTSLYVLIVQFLFGLGLLSLVYIVGPFGAPEVCPIDGSDSWSSCYGSNWSTTRLAQAVRLSVGHDDVELFATWKSGGYIKLVTIALALALTMPGAVLSSSYLPGFKLAVTFVIVATLMASIGPIIAYFLLGNEESRIECIASICDASQVLLVGTNPSGRDVLNCAGLQVNYAALGSLCMPAETALLPQFGVFQMISMAIMSDVMFISNPPEYVEQVLIPSFGDDVDCTGNACRFPFAQELFFKCLGYMVLGGVLLLILGYSFLSIFSFPGPRVLRLKVFFTGLWEILSGRKKARARESKNGSTDNVVVDEEVQKESDKVSSILRDVTERTDSDAEEGSDFDDVWRSGDRDVLPPVLTYRLQKVYPSLGGRPPRTAVKSLDLHVEKGQVLGLLGQNGAGKTTTIKVLAGAHDASNGIALVAGYNSSTETIKVFENLGNCQQFDVVWPGQTVRRHLEFFCMLKGLPRAQSREIALSVAKAVGLGTNEVFNRQAQHLSGGMRRRLSIAIALIGSPSVLFLDEPTTGLDPSTRNSIWNLIHSFSTEDRAIIVTTHLMLEADTLCNRIAIMSEGELKVIGTQQALKDRFGSGYLLQLNLVKSSKHGQTRALDFVRQHIHKDAVLQGRQAKTLRVIVPRENLDLSHVFRVLYSPDTATQGGINQFMLSQSSLEDVFLAVCEN